MPGPATSLAASPARSLAASLATSLARAFPGAARCRWSPRGFERGRGSDIPPGASLSRPRSGRRGVGRGWGRGRLGGGIGRPGGSLRVGGASALPGRWSVRGGGAGDSGARRRTALLRRVLRWTLRQGVAVRVAVDVAQPRGGRFRHRWSAPHRGVVGLLTSPSEHPTTAPAWKKKGGREAGGTRGAPRGIGRRPLCPRASAGPRAVEAGRCPRSICMGPAGARPGCVICVINPLFPQVATVRAVDLCH